jgi:hypothetical protein
MDAVINDLLLFISVAVPPIIFGLLLYLGLHISGHDDAGSSRLKDEQKHPYRLQP